MTRAILLILTMYVVSAASAGPAFAASLPTGNKQDDVDVETLHTLAGNGFLVLKPRSSSPAPTLLMFAMEAKTTLLDGDYNHIAKTLQKNGWLVVSMDVPCMGDDHRQGEPEGLDGWRFRIEKGENIVSDVRRRVSDVIDYLIKSKMADPARISAAGISRGGFMALQSAAADPRIKRIAALAPVTDLSALTEFKGLHENDLVKSLALRNVAPQLADRPIWITIGSTDERVGTDFAVELSRLITLEAVKMGMKPDVEIHVVTNQGHTRTSQQDEDAAGWAPSGIADSS